MKPTRVGIIGFGQSEFKPRRDDANYPELVREGVTLALHNAGRELNTGIGNAPRDRRADTIEPRGLGSRLRGRDGGSCHPC